MTVKNSVTVKKWMTSAKNHNFVVPHHRHLFPVAACQTPDSESMRSAAG